MNSNAQWRVLASRPVHHNGAWKAQLRQAGFQVLSVPLLEITPVVSSLDSDPECLEQKHSDQQYSDQKYNAVKRAILDLDQFFAVIFVSQNAVALTFNWIEDYWPQLPEGICFFGIGEKTCEAIQQRTALFGQQAIVEVNHDAPMTTEGLLQHPKLHYVKEQKILICRGLGGRSLLGEQLQQRGASVTYCESYYRQCPVDAVEQMRIGLANLDPKSQTVFAVFSGETLDHLVSILKELHQHDAFHMPLLVPSARVAGMAQEKGFDCVIEATNASQDHMLEALQRFVAQK